MGKEWLLAACSWMFDVAEQEAPRAYLAFPQPLGRLMQSVLFGVWRGGCLSKKWAKAIRKCSIMAMWWMP